ncbi:hypothetical protein IJI91_01975 [Candidatus Saccharibacteria bacterium]|nr:hypothetical protein [Candidatus Saccharibacteria bacterium]
MDNLDERDRRHRSEYNPTKDSDISPMSGIRETARGYVKTHSSGEAGRRQAASTAALQAAEDSASAEPDNSDIKEREGEPKTSTFTSSFVSKVTGDKKKGSFKVIFKKYRTLIFIFGLLGLGSGGVLMSQSMLGPNLVGRMLDEANPQFISNHLRSPTVFRYAVEKDKFTKEQKEEFKKHGIEIVDKKENGKKYKKPRVKYIDDKGKTHIVTVKKAMKDDSFRIKYESASKAYDGQYAGQHDSLAIKLRKILGVSLDNWHSWRNDTKDDDPQTKRKKFREIVKEKMVSKFGGESTRANDAGEEEGRSEGEVDKNQKKAEISATLRNVVNAAFTGVAMGECGKFAVATALNAYTMGISFSNSFTVASTLLEAVQKAQAGDGTESPIHEALNSITEVDPNTGTSALESTGLGDLFSGATGTANGDISSNVERLFVIGKQTIADFNTCATLSTAASVGSLVLSVFSGGVGGSVSKGVAKALIGIGTSVGASLIIKGAIQAYIDSATDAIKREFDTTNNLSGEAYGDNLYNGGTELLGRTAQIGGSSYLSTEMVEQYEKGKQAALNDQAEYERATKSPFDTSSRYTFLGSLVNNSLFPLATAVSTSSIGSTLSQSSSVLFDSISSMLPSASAIGATHAVTIQGECPVSNSINATGNRPCIDYRGTDTSTIDDDCDQECVIKYIMKHYDAFVETEFTLTPTIKENTNLWRYQKYCGLRGSQAGLFDGDITSQINEENGGTSLAAKISESSFLSSLPFIGELSDIISNINQAGKSDWITGEACVAGNKHWDEYKWYQRFLEDQRLMVNMGIIEQSSGEALVTAYLEEHPLDDSREGVIARLSGLTKDTVIALEDEMFYESYLANDYDPANLGPVYHEDIEPPLDLATHTPTSNLDSTEIIVLERIVYAPLQSRTQLV